MISDGQEQNFVEVEPDFSDLEGRIQDLLANPAKAREIAARSAEVFRDIHLTPAAQACYWRRMIDAWASVSFTPAGWEEVGGEVRLRGIPLETFVM